MKDYFFYPLAIAIIAGMVIFALSFQVDNTPANADIYELQGSELEDLFPSPGTTFTLGGPEDELYAVLSAHMSRDIAPPSAGVFGTLGSVYESNFGGSTIRITISAKQGEDPPSGAMDLGYFTSGVGDSEWQKFELTDEFAEYSFEYSPAIPSEKGNDYVGIWPDPSGKGGEIIVKSIKVERLDAPPALRTQSPSP